MVLCVSHHVCTYVRMRTSKMKPIFHYKSQNIITANISSYMIVLIYCISNFVGALCHVVEVQEGELLSN